MVWSISIVQVKSEKKTRVAEPGTQRTIVEEGHWAKAIEDFWTPCEQPMAKRQKRSYKEIPRLASLTWIRELDNAIRNSIKRRLHEFVLDIEKVLKLLADDTFTLAELNLVAPFLSCVLDQAPWQTCGASFLRFDLGVLMICHWDPGAHRVHNDFKMGVKYAKLQSTVYLTTTLLTFITGPTKSAGRWLTNIQETLLDLEHNTLPNDSNLQKLWPRICKEKNWRRDVETNEHARKNFLANLKFTNLTARQGEAIALNRWLSYPKGEIERRSQWSENTFILINWGITTGSVSKHWQVWKDKPTFKAAPEPAAVEDAPALDADAAVHDGSRPSTTESASEMYKRCKNQIHVCLEISANNQLQEESVRIGTLCGPMLRHHSSWMTGMATPEGCKKFYLESANWSHISELHDLLDIFGDLSKLEEMGLIISPQSKLAGPPSDSKLEEQDSVANDVWTLAFGFFRARACTIATYAGSYPHQLGLVLSDNPMVIKQLFDDIRVMCKAFGRVKQSTHPELKGICARSPMSEPIMKLTSALLLREPMITVRDLQVLEDYLRQVFDGVATVKLCEDTNKEARSAETREQCNKEMTRIRRSLVPVNAKMMERYGRKTLPGISTLQAPKPTEDLFRLSEVHKKTEKLKYDKILGEVMPSIPGHELYVLAAEQSFVKHLDEAHMADRVDEYWVSSLLPEQQLVVNVITKHIFLVVRVVEQKGSLVYPFEEEDMFFYPVKANKLEFIHVDDLAEWRVAPSRMRSPFRILSTNAWLPRKLGMVLRRAGPNMEILHWHALSAFSMVDEKTLSRLFSDLGLSLHMLGAVGKQNQKEAMALLLMSTMKPGITEQECIDAVQHGLELLAPEDVAALEPIVEDVELLMHVVKQNEAQSWKSWVSSQKHKKQEHTKSLEAVKTITEKLKACKTIVAKAKPKPKPAKKFSAASQKRIRDQMTEGHFAVLNELRPDAYRINVEEAGACLRIIHKGKRVTSFAWTLRGKSIAIEECLKEAWRLAALDGHPCPHKWIL